METKDKMIGISISFSDVYQPKNNCKDCEKEKCNKWQIWIICPIKVLGCLENLRTLPAIWNTVLFFALVCWTLFFDYFFENLYIFLIQQSTTDLVFPCIVCHKWVLVIILGWNKIVSHVFNPDKDK